MFLMLTDKPLSDSSVDNKVTVSVVQVTFSQSLIECEQVQVDSIMQVELHIVHTHLQRKQHSLPYNDHRIIHRQSIS